MERLNYHHLHAFWMVAREGGFTRAAEKLRIAQSAVSTSVSALENALGVPLLIRSTSRKLELTEAGHETFEHAEEIFALGARLSESVKPGSAQRSLRFGSAGSLSKNIQIRLLRPLLEKSDFELTFQTGDPETLLERLATQKLDAVLCTSPFSPSSSWLPLIQREIAKARYCLIGKPGRSSRTLKSRIEAEGIYLPGRDDPATPEILAFLGNAKIKAPIRGWIDDIAMLRLIALETPSVVVIPEIGAIRELKNRELVIHHTFKDLHQRFYLVMKRQSAKSKTLIDLMNRIEIAGV